MRSVRSLFAVMMVGSVVLVGLSGSAGTAAEPALGPAAGTVEQVNGPRSASAGPSQALSSASSLTCDEMHADWDRVVAEATAAGEEGVACVRPGDPEKARAYLERRQRNGVAFEPVPDWCLELAFQGYHVTCTQSCAVIAHTIVVTNHETGEVAAELDTVIIDYAYTFADATSTSPTSRARSAANVRGCWPPSAIQTGSSARTFSSFPRSTSGATRPCPATRWPAASCRSTSDPR